MKNFGIVAGSNLGILLLYSLVIRIIFMSDNSRDRPMDILYTSAFAVGIHVIVCFLISVIAYVSGKSEWGKAWLATTGVVLLIGFSVCLGNAALG
jgi:hypothetical protein